MKKLYTLLLFTFLFGSANLQANVSGDTAVCAGEKVTYYVPYIAGASYSWNISGGNALSSLTTDSLIVQWTTAGVGTIIVTQNNPAASHFLNVTIHPKPTPVITHAPYATCPSDTGSSSPNTGQGDGRRNCNKVCKFATITYTTILNPSSTYLWTYSGALTVTGALTNTVTVTWDSTATGNLTVYETNIFGCTDSSTICIEKVDLPIANFSHQLSVCKNSPTLFTNLSTGATSYQWYFGDGGTSTATNPSHGYANAGSYTITLIAMNDCHCTDTFQSVINVDSLPGAVISCPSTVCPNTTVTYTTPNSPGCIYTWFAIGGTITGGQGTPSVTVQWGPGQLGTLGLNITGCGTVCSDTTLIYIPIVPTVAVISGATKVCPGDCEIYTLPLFSGATYKWSLNSGACGAIADSTCCEKVEICWPNFSFLNCNDTLTVAFYDTFLHCGGTGQFIINVRPRLSIFGSTTVCANNSTNFFASNSIVCNWSVSPLGPIITPAGPSASPSISWQNLPGTYIVTAVPVNPNLTCSNSAYTVVTAVAVPPTLVITGDTVICANSTLSYCAPSANTVNWVITGGTPVTSIGNCISITWGNTPPFIVRAYQSLPNSPFCNSDTAVQNVTLAPLTIPVINGSLLACANANSSFNCPTLYPAGTTFTWSVLPANAGAVVAGQGTPNVTFEWGNNAPQVVSVQLTVNVCGSVLTSIIPVTLNPVPTPSVVQIGSLCAGGTAQLQAVGGAYIAYNWSGPGGITTLNPKTILVDGLYQVTVTDANSCTALSQKNVQYVSGPTASISTLNALGYCIGDVYIVNFCALGNANYTYNWSPSGLTQCISASVPGSYSVVVTDITNGCTANSNVLTISEGACPPFPGVCQPAGSVSFTHSSCNPISFVNTSVNASSFSWNFGDFTGSGLANPPPHTYAQAGFYLVSLSGFVPNSAGTDSCRLTDTAQIEIPLAAKFDFTTGCYNTPVCFTDKSTYTAGNSITSYSWNFGDLSLPSVTANPCHLYAVSGTYIVTLTVSNGLCTAIFKDTLTVPAAPNAAFTTSNPNCINQAVLFTDNSTPSLFINYWSWTFNDGGTSLNQNPNHSYSTPSIYSDTLIIKDIYGCYDTVVNNVTVVAPSLTGNIVAYPDTVVCAGTSVVLVAPACATCTYLWNNGAVNDSITVTNSGIYAVTITDLNGCPYTTFIRIIVNNGPPAIIQNSGDADLCLGESTVLSVPYSANWLYLWTSNDPAINGSTFYQAFVSPLVAGVYTYQISITDTTTGCSDTSAFYTITVHQPPVVPIITPLTPPVICFGDTVVLVATHPDPTVTFAWTNGQINDTVYITKNGCYGVEVTDTNGCTNNATYCVTVNPLPELCSFYEGCFDTCAPFLIKGPVGGASYLWLMNGVSTGVTTQNFTATVSGTYAVIVTTSFGCVDTTGNLNLTLYPCDTLCAELEIDSVYCDSSGNYIMQYHVINNTIHTVTEVSLQALPPFLSLLYSPNLNFTSVAPGDTSPTFTTTIYNGNPGDVICFRVRTFMYDTVMEMNMECCISDTQCVTLPPCHIDSTCCYFKYISDTTWCTQGPTGTQHHFQIKINGCGNLTIQQAGGTGTLSGISNSYTLSPGITTISGIYNSATDTVLCLTYLMQSNNVYCKDTTICFSIKCVPTTPPCTLLFNDTICRGQSSTFTYGGPTAGLTFLWQFTNGTPATATGPGPHTVTYGLIGCHPVILIISQPNKPDIDCIATICVLAQPVATVTQTGNTLYAFPAGYNYQWYNGTPFGSPILGAVNQFYSPLISGFYCVVVSGGDNCNSTACIDHQYVSISELEASSWSIYPNPNNGSFTLSFNANKAEPMELKITNTIGEVVDHRNLDVKLGDQQFFISNKNFSSGIYFIEMKLENSRGMKRMMVK